MLIYGKHIAHTHISIIAIYYEGLVNRNLTFMVNKQVQTENYVQTVKNTTVKHVCVKAFHNRLTVRRRPR